MGSFKVSIWTRYQEFFVEIFLGKEAAFSNIDIIPYYPTITMMSIDSKITCNFGDKDFMFNIAKYIKEEKSEIVTGISD